MPKTQKDPIVQETPLNLPVRNKNLAKWLPWILVLLILIAAGAFAATKYHQAKVYKQQLEDLKQNPQKASEEEAADLINKVSQLIELPKEQPTIATVSDLGPLKDQPFFANAQVGDKVLIFSQAKKAILYRPSTNKVIEVAPVDLGNSSTKAGTTTENSSNTNSTTNSNTSSSTTNKASNTTKNTNTK